MGSWLSIDNPSVRNAIYLMLTEGWTDKELKDPKYFDFGHGFGDSNEIVDYAVELIEANPTWDHHTFKDIEEV